MNASGVFAFPSRAAHAFRSALLSHLLVLGVLLPHWASAQVSQSVPVDRYTVLSPTSVKHEAGNLLDDNTFRSLASGTTTLFSDQRPVMEAISGKVVMARVSYDAQQALGHIPQWRRSDVEYVYSFQSYVVVCVSGMGDPDAPSVFSVSPLLSATKGKPYTLALQGIAGTMPYRWDIVAGALPHGLSLAASGTISGIPVTAGEATFTARLTDDQGRTASKSLTLAVTEPPPLPNLRAYQPPEWSDSLVVSSVPGTYQSTAVYDDEVVYIDFAYVNEEKTSPITGAIYATVSVDGAPPTEGFWNGLPVNYYNSGEDYAFGPFSAGTHTVQVFIDSRNSVAETREDDNLFSTTFGVVSRLSSAIRLTKAVPFQNVSAGANGKAYFVVSIPAGQDRLEVTTTGGTGNCDLYVRKGSLPSTSAFDASSRAAGAAESVVINTPSPGDYYILLYGVSAFSGVSILADYAPSLPNPNLQVWKLDGWPSPLVISTAQGVHRDATLIYDDTPLFASFAFRASPGTKDIARSFSVALYSDEKRLRQWTSPAIQSGVVVTNEDIPIGTLAPGTHFISVVVDDGNVVSEADERDNRLSKPITVSVHPGEPSLMDQVVITDVNSNLFVVDLLTGTVTRTLGKTKTLLANIAFHPSGVLFGIGSRALYRIDPTSAVLTQVGLTSGSFASLGSTDDGVLYAGTEQLVHPNFSSLDLYTGGDIDSYNTPSGIVLGGDLTSDGHGGLYAVSDTGLLAQWIPTTKSWRSIGDTGLKKSAFGLALASDGHLYAIQNTKRIWRIDRDTGAATLQATITDARVGEVYGAAAEFRSGRGSTLKLVSPPLSSVAEVNGVKLFGFSFPTAPGVHYHIETAATANPSSWTWVQSVSGDGAVKDFYTAAVRSSAYYRVRGFTSGFLTFPLHLNATPHTTRITSIFDHSGAGSGADGRVVAYTNERGARTSEPSDTLIEGPANDPIYSYKNSSGTPFTLDGQYSPRPIENAVFLSYDGHTGYDYPALQGTDVFAAADGTAQEIDESAHGGGTKDARIDHGNGYSSFYLHLDPQNTTIGPTPRTVTRGEKIGTVGPYAFGTHLHFTVWRTYKDGTSVKVDPYGWEGAVGADPSQVDGKDNVCLWLGCE